MVKGQKVVCVNDTFPASIRALYQQLPVKDNIYTIREVFLGREKVVKGGDTSGSRAAASRTSWSWKSTSRSGSRGLAIPRVSHARRRWRRFRLAHDIRPLITSSRPDTARPMERQP